MEISGHDFIELYTRLGEITELLRNISQDQAEMKADIKDIMIFSGERKYIYGLIVGLYSAGIGFILKSMFF